LFAAADQVFVFLVRQSYHAALTDSKISGKMVAVKLLGYAGCRLLIIYLGLMVGLA
jgi:hypothetical protein